MLSEIFYYAEKDLSGFLQKVINFFYEKVNKEDVYYNKIYDKQAIVSRSLNDDYDQETYPELFKYKIYYEGVKTPIEVYSDKEQLQSNNFIKVAEL